MGLKIAVVGGGSTYTPELVEGVVDRTATLPVDELVLHDIDGERLAVVAGLAERILRRQGWPGRLVSTTERDQALDGADFVLVQLRVGGQAARYSDETLPHRFGCIGQETTGPGGFAKALRTVPVVLELAEEVGRRRAGRLDRRLHEPGRDRHPGAARCRPSGDRPVQRGDRVPAPVRRALRRGARAGRARARRAQPPDLGAGGPGRRGRPAPGAPRARCSRDRSRRASSRSTSCVSRRSPRTTSTTTTPRARSSRSSWPAGPGRRTSWPSSASCSRCTAIRTSTGSRPARAARRGVLQRGRGPAHRLAP